MIHNIAPNTYVADWVGQNGETSMSKSTQPCVRPPAPPCTVIHMSDERTACAWRGFNVEMKCTNLKADDVRVLQLLEQRDLPDGGGGDALLLRLEPDLLHGDDLAGLLVPPLKVQG